MTQNPRPSDTNATCREDATPDVAHSQRGKSNSGESSEHLTVANREESS